MTGVCESPRELLKRMENPQTLTGEISNSVLQPPELVDSNATQFDPADAGSPW